jgi:hypothetical protein
MKKMNTFFETLEEILRDEIGNSSQVLDILFIGFKGNPDAEFEIDTLINSFCEKMKVRFFEDIYPYDFQTSIPRDEYSILIINLSEIESENFVDFINRGLRWTRGDGLLVAKGNREIIVETKDSDFVDSNFVARLPGICNNALASDSYALYCRKRRNIKSDNIFGEVK